MSVPDPNAKRDRALERFATAQERQNKHLEALTRSIREVGRSAVPAFRHLTEILATFNEQSGVTISTGQMEFDETGYTSAVTDPFVPDDGMISVLVADLSIKEVQEAGYELLQSNVGPYIRIPRLEVLRRETPDGT